MVTSFMPRTQLILFTFPDAVDPLMIVETTESADLIHTESEQVSRYLRRYEYVRSAVLSEVGSLSFLSDLADQIISGVGLHT